MLRGSLFGAGATLRFSGFGVIEGGALSSRIVGLASAEKRLKGGGAVLEGGGGGGGRADGGGGGAAISLGGGGGNTSDGGGGGGALPRDVTPFIMCRDYVRGGSRELSNCIKRL